MTPKIPEMYGSWGCLPKNKQTSGWGRMYSFSLVLIGFVWLVKGEFLMGELAFEKASKRAN